jgi:hypothetical protein
MISGESNEQQEMLGHGSNDMTHSPADIEEQYTQYKKRVKRLVPFLL